MRQDLGRHCAFVRKILRLARSLLDPGVKQPVHSGVRAWVGGYTGCGRSSVWGFCRDLRYGTRTLLTNWSFTIAAVLSLALAIAPTTIIFSFANALLLRPLPVTEPDRLFAVYTSQDGGIQFGATSYPDYRDLEERNTAFSGLAAHSYFPMALRAEGRPEVVMGQLVTANYFSVLGVQMFLGRAFLAEENQAPGAHPVCVISHRTWKQRFGSDRRILGKTIHVNDFPFTVVGVAPPELRGLRVIVAPDVWVPTMMVEQAYPYHVYLDGRSDPWLELVGRLRPEYGSAQAQSALNAIAAVLAQEHGVNRGKGFTLVAADRSRAFGGTTDDLKRLTAVLACLVGVVLLIASLNVTNLQLARAAERRREMALRISLGASRRHVFRQLLAESVVLAGLAGGAGLWLAYIGSDLLLALRPRSFFPLELDLTLDWRMLAFATAAVLVVGVAAGLAPGLQAFRGGESTALKEQSLSLTRSRGGARVRAALVVGQLALCLVLLVSAGLFLRSLGKMLDVDPGFETRNGLILPINLGFGRYQEGEGRQFYEEVVSRVRRLPGVETAALAAYVPLGESQGRHYIKVEGYQPGPDEWMVIRRNMIGPGYFDAMGIQVIGGRGIDESDRENTQPVAVVNQTMAHRYWPGRSAIGGRFRVGNKTHEVVGVIADGKYGSLSELPQPYFCMPLRQDKYEKRLHLVIKSAGDPGVLRPLVVREIERLDRGLPIDVMTIAEHLKASLAGTKGNAVVIGSFGILALVLAVVGVYGVVSFTVSRRTHEFGIRMAVGARRHQILTMVLGQGMRMTVLGVGLGVGLAVAATRFLSGFLFGVDALDPSVFVLVSGGLAGVALVACYIPARRATLVDPVSTLRYE